MAGPLCARLAGSDDAQSFRRPRPARLLRQRLPGGREVTAWIGRELMIGAETSDLDWGGWSQFMPVTAHWARGQERAALWLLDPHVVHAVAGPRTIEINAPGAELRFR